MNKIFCRAFSNSHNFIKTSQSKAISNQHSLIKYLFLYKFNTDNVGYIILEPSKKELIAFDTGEFHKSHKIISELEQRFQAKLTHIFSTHKHEDHVGGNLEWLKARPNLKIIGSSTEWSQIPGLNQENAMHDI